MPSRLSWLCLAAVALLLTGCSHTSYTRSFDTDTLTADDPSNIHVEGYDLTYQTNELVLADRLGIVCGSLMTTTEAAGNAASARRKAIEKGERRYEYEYRRHSPAEYSGIDCGGYFRWGRGTGQLNLEAGQYDMDAYPLEAKTSEGGLHIGGTDFFFQLPWLRYSFFMRLGLGSYGFIHDYPNTGFPETQLDNDDDQFFFRMPFLFSLKFFPAWLFGFGVEPYGGVDPIMLTFGKKWGEFYKHFDYGARAGYALTFDAFAVGLFGAYGRRNVAWGEYISQADSFSVTLSLDLNYEEF